MTYLYNELNEIVGAQSFVRWILARQVFVDAFGLL